MHTHHRPGPHRPHNHQWFYNAEEATSAAGFAPVLRRIADDLEKSGVVKLGDVEAKLAEEITATVRYERTPHGSLVLKIEAEWDDAGGQRAKTTSLADLVG